jgi:hypothetical protein
VKQGEAARRPPHTESITLADDPPSLTERRFNARVDRWERRARARERLQAQDRHRRIARMADELMPLWLYYSRRWAA